MVKSTKKESHPDLFPESPFPPYLAPVASRIQRIYKFDSNIGEGKNGMTFKLQNRSSHSFLCLKTISSAITEPGERNRIRETLKKEVTILSPLRHHCLPQIAKRFFKGLFVPPKALHEGSQIVSSTIDSYRLLSQCHRRLTPGYR